MATCTAATVIKFNVALRRSTLQEAAVVLQERAWVQEAIGDLARRGKSLLDCISRSASNHAKAATVATGDATGLAVGNVALRRCESAGIFPDDPLESVVANLVTRRGHSQGPGKSSLQLAQAGDVDLEGARRPSSVAAKLSKMERVPDEDYLWETDPNGGWLASFP